MSIRSKIVSIIFLFALCLACNKNPFVQGERIYNTYCINCHMADGKGFKLLYPPLAESDYLKENFDELACIIRYGIQDTIIVNDKEYSLPMPGIKELNEIEITNVINYINFRWQYREEEIKLEDVVYQLASCN